MNRFDRFCKLCHEFLTSALWALEQQWIVRWIIGGHWILMDDEWLSAHVEHSSFDGTKFYTIERMNGLKSSFHESFNGIQDHEYH